MSISGPIANLILAFFWGFVVVFSAYVPESYQAPLVQMAGYGVMVNSIWVAFSLIPILPWDGGIFIDTFLNAKQSMQFRKIEPYGTWIILILLFTGLLAKLIAGEIQNFKSVFLIELIESLQFLIMRSEAAAG